MSRRHLGIYFLAGVAGIWIGVLLSLAGVTL
jgi:hypothetical protein